MAQEAPEVSSFNRILNLSLFYLFKVISIHAIQVHTMGMERVTFIITFQDTKEQLDHIQSMLQHSSLLHFHRIPTAFYQQVDLAHSDRPNKFNDFLYVTHYDFHSDS
jgi:hypothetical protein